MIGLLPHPRSPIAAAMLAMLLVVGSSPSIAQTTQPTEASVMEAQPIKRALRSPTSAGAAQPNPASNFDWQRLLGAMGIVLGLIFVLKFLIGKIYPGINAGSGSRVVRVLARSPIAPKQQVMLLHIGRRIVVVGDSAGQLSTLCDIEDADEVAALLGQIDNQETVTTPRKAFTAMFGRARQEFETPPPEEVIEKPALDPGIENAQTEISGLIDRMRTLTRVVRRED